jgi:hypothetical protein
MKRFEVEYFMNGERLTIEVGDVEHEYEAIERILETFEVGDATEIKNTQENMNIRRFDESKKEESPEISFDAKELVDKDTDPGFTTNVEDQEKLEKAFKKEMDKVVKFENFVTINIENIENVEMEIENDCDDTDREEKSGCGCCDECTGEPGCYCGCEDCICSIDDEEMSGTEDVISFGDFKNEIED